MDGLVCRRSHRGGGGYIIRGDETSTMVEKQVRIARLSIIFLCLLTGHLLFRKTPGLLEDGLLEEASQAQAQAEVYYS